MHPSPTPSFRPDIEGLRALAVLLVVAGHAHVPGLAGGYIGVDVFFVISGYLITRLLHAEWCRTGRIDIPAFYARRLRRLLPAFALMLAFVLTAIRIVYAPIEQPWALASAQAATLYFSNVYYALASTHYMAPLTRLDPLLHTWSLGVEEQFYLVWPLLLLGAGWMTKRAKGSQRAQGLLLGGVVVVSFLACLHLTGTRQPLAFFLPFTRAWEFGLGAMVAVFGDRLLAQGQPLARLLARRGRTETLTLGSLALIVGAALLLTEKSTFPGMAALLPVTGTTLLILLLPAAPASALAGRLLALPLLQWLGRLSYGWYLWHWPLLVFGRLLLPAPSLLADLFLVLTALLAAQLSHTLVEQPLRFGRFFRRAAPTFGMAALLTLSAVLAIRLADHSAHALAESPRFNVFTAAQSDLPIVNAFECDGWYHDARLVQCLGGAPEGRKVAVVLGDSHASQWLSPLDDILRRRGWQLVLMTKSACPIIDQDYFYARIGRVFTECRDWKAAALRRIQELRPSLLIVSNAETYDFTAHEWEAGIGRLLQPLAAASRQVVILRDSPAPGFSAPECLARQEWNPVLHRRPCSFEPSPAAAPGRAYAALAARQPNVRIVDMTAAICRESPCLVRAGDTVKYWDPSHMTETFVRSLTGPLETALETAGTF